MVTLQERVARELFWIDWDREHTIYLVASGDWEECEEHIKTVYLKEADTIISSVVQYIKGVPNPTEFDKESPIVIKYKPYGAAEVMRQRIISELLESATNV